MSELKNEEINEYLSRIKFYNYSIKRFEENFGCVAEEIGLERNNSSVGFEEGLNDILSCKESFKVRKKLFEEGIVALVDCSYTNAHHLGIIIFGTPIKIIGKKRGVLEKSSEGIEKMVPEKVLYELSNSLKDYVKNYECSEMGKISEFMIIPKFSHFRSIQYLISYDLGILDQYLSEDEKDLFFGNPKVRIAIRSFFNNNLHKKYEELLKKEG